MPSTGVSETTRGKINPPYVPIPKTASRFLASQFCCQGHEASESQRNQACRWPDSNRHGPFRAQRILSPLRLPFRHIGFYLGTTRPYLSHLRQTAFDPSILCFQSRSYEQTPHTKETIQCAMFDS